MPSTSETGHAKNVANFEDLISFCNGYGTSYNPSKGSLTIDKLIELQNDAQKSLQQTKINKTSFANTTNVRQMTFKNLKPLSTKIVNALAVSGAIALVVDDAKTINRKIQGTKSNGNSKVPSAPLDPKEITPSDKSHSTSQQSYDSLIDHFEKLLETISQESKYNPNEAELKTATLQIKFGSLKTANSDLINAYTNWSNSMIQRNSLLYNPLTGLVQTALDVKKYVTSVYGASSPQFKQVSGLEFKNIKDR